MSRNSALASELMVSCAADDHIVTLRFDEDHGHVFYLALYIGSFYARQSSWVQRWRERLKGALLLLLGREYLFDDVVLTKEDVAQIGKWCSGAAREAPDG